MSQGFGWQAGNGLVCCGSHDLILLSPVTTRIAYSYNAQKSLVEEENVSFNGAFTINGQSGALSPKTRT